VTAPYNLSFMNGSTNLLLIAQGVNDNLGGFFGGLLVLIFFVLFFLVALGLGADIRRVFVADSFLTLILTAFLWGAGLVEGWVIMVPVLLLVVSLLVLLFSD
jgi:hypothetical protein